MSEFDCGGVVYKAIIGLLLNGIAKPLESLNGSKIFRKQSQLAAVFLEESIVELSF